MSKVGPRGRSTGEPRHVRLYEWLQKSPAWRTLDVYARSLYIEFKARYTGTNNGDIAFSGKEMEAALNCSNRPADRALATLIERGFVKVAKRGSFNWKRAKDGQARATTYILTEYSIDLPTRSSMPPTKDFMKWQPNAKKSRGDESTAMGGRDHPAKPSPRGRDHPIEVTTSPDEAHSDALSGVTRAPPYSLPHTLADPIPSEESMFNAWISRNIPDRTYHREAYRLLRERKMTPEVLRRMAA